MLNTDLLAASECSYLRSCTQQHVTILPHLDICPRTPTQGTILEWRKRCVLRSLCACLSDVRTFCNFFCSFCFWHWALTWSSLFSYWFYQSLCDSEATTVASMVERSKQDGGAGWLADRDLEDGCSFCNIFLWYSISTLEFQHLQDLTFHEFHELEVIWMSIESTQVERPKVLRNESVYRCNMKSSWQTEIFHPLQVRLEEKLSFKHVTPWRIPGRTCRSISWETFLRRVKV